MNDILQTRQFENLIFELRGFKVMIDTDLASLYETETKRLKEQVKRNIVRFPDDFMFELTLEEKEQLVANCDRLNSLKHSSINPMAFTEQGVAMLSSVLRSPKAVKINIEIMRAFVYYRQILLQNQDLYKKVNELDDKINHVYSFLLNKIEIHKSSIEPVGYKLKSKKEQK
ncbi:MAG: ORF6N domain-containing protein [Daejeonella sp.]|uniref:ORF6N domain-containing protein n=1 Tax=Daejeonella sp. TaxID=2805397 RepID=UPI0027330FD0|nr:ORF6N domain-containing protein [Daejeonella sp.]MDP3467855.1 ORF6N domain-containing protein [Daejeonella sp.]